MDHRLPANKAAAPLLDLIERRFSVHLEAGPVDHLRAVCEHYGDKRDIILSEHGEAEALRRDDYAKAVLISEAARLLLREIDPRPRKSKKKIKKDPTR